MPVYTETKGKKSTEPHCPQCNREMNPVDTTCLVCRYRSGAISFRTVNDQHLDMMVEGQPVGILYKVADPPTKEASWRLHFAECPPNAPDGTRGMNYDTRSFNLHGAMRSATAKWYDPPSIPIDIGGGDACMKTAAA